MLDRALAVLLCWLFFRMRSLFILLKQTHNQFMKGNWRESFWSLFVFHAFDCHIHSSALLDFIYCAAFSAPWAPHKRKFCAESHVCSLPVSRFHVNRCPRSVAPQYRIGRRRSNPSGCCTGMPVHPNIGTSEMVPRSRRYHVYHVFRRLQKFSRPFVWTSPRTYSTAWSITSY